MSCMIPLANHHAPYGNQQRRYSKLLQAVGTYWSQKLSTTESGDMFTLGPKPLQWPWALHSEQTWVNLIMRILIYRNREIQRHVFGFCMFLKKLSSFCWLYTWSFFRWCGFPAQTNVDMEIRIWNLGRNQKHVISWGVGFAISLLLDSNLAFNYTSDSSLATEKNELNLEIWKWLLLGCITLLPFYNMNWWFSPSYWNN